MTAPVPLRADPLVVAIGQPLGGDDAVGLVVAERLRTTGIPTRTVSDGSALAELLSTVPRAILLDAVVGAGPAGTIVHLSGDALVDLASDPRASRAGSRPVSCHGISVALAVSIARALGGATDVQLVGVAVDPPGPLGEAPVPGALTTLSPAVAAAVDVAVLRVHDLLNRSGG